MAIGFHTPERTRKVLSRLRKETSLNWVDCSWGNDCTDSIILELSENEAIVVYIPNSRIQDSGEELFNQYSITDLIRSEYFDYSTIKEVIKHIKKSLK